MPGAATREALERLEREHDDARAALRWALEHPSARTVEFALRLAGALVEFWRIRGDHREGQAWLEGLLALPAAAASGAPRAKALVGAGWLGRYLPDRARARAWAEAGLARARALGDPRLIILGLRSLT